MLQKGVLVVAMNILDPFPIKLKQMSEGLILSKVKSNHVCGEPYSSV